MVYYTVTFFIASYARRNYKPLKQKWNVEEREELRLLNRPLKTKQKSGAAVEKADEVGQRSQRCHIQSQIHRSLCEPWEGEETLLDPRTHEPENQSHVKAGKAPSTSQKASCYNCRWCWRGGITTPFWGDPRGSPAGDEWVCWRFTDA